MQLQWIDNHRIGFEVSAFIICAWNGHGNGSKEWRWLEFVFFFCLAQQEHLIFLYFSGRFAFRFLLSFFLILSISFSFILFFCLFWNQNFLNRLKSTFESGNELILEKTVGKIRNCSWIFCPLCFLILVKCEVCFITLKLLWFLSLEIIYLMF